MDCWEAPATPKSHTGFVTSIQPRYSLLKLAETYNTNPPKGHKLGSKNAALLGGRVREADAGPHEPFALGAGLLAALLRLDALYDRVLPGHERAADPLAAALREGPLARRRQRVGAEVRVRHRRAAAEEQAAAQVASAVRVVRAPATSVRRQGRRGRRRRKPTRLRSSSSTTRSRGRREPIFYD